MVSHGEWSLAYFLLCWKLRNEQGCKQSRGLCCLWICLGARRIAEDTSALPAKTSRKSRSFRARCHAECISELSAYREWSWKAQRHSLVWFSAPFQWASKATKIIAPGTPARTMHGTKSARIADRWCCVNTGKACSDGPHAEPQSVSAYIALQQETRSQ